MGDMELEKSETRPIQQPKTTLTPTTFVKIKVHQNSIFLSPNFTLAPPASTSKSLIIDFIDYGQDSEKANILGLINIGFASNLLK